MSPPHHTYIDRHRQETHTHTHTVYNTPPHTPGMPRRKIQIGPDRSRSADQRGRGAARHREEGVKRAEGAADWQEARGTHIKLRLFLGRFLFQVCNNVFIFLQVDLNFRLWSLCKCNTYAVSMQLASVVSMSPRRNEQQQHGFRPSTCSSAQRWRGLRAHDQNAGSEASRRRRCLCQCAMCTCDTCTGNAHVQLLPVLV